MRQKKSVKLNYIYNLFYQVLLIVVPLITAPYLSRVLEPDGIGTISYAESIVAYFVLFAALGMQRYGQREVSYVQNDAEERSKVFWNTKALSFITTIIVLAIYIPFALTQENKMIYLILALNIVNVFADVSWLFQGMEDFGKIVLRNTIIKVLSIVFIFVFVKQKEDLLLYVVWLTLATLICSISLWPELRKYIRLVPIKEINPFNNFGIIFSLFIPTIAIEIYTVLDKTMIGVITSNVFQNGYYEQAIKISKMALAVITALGTVMVPRIGSLFQEGNTNAIKNAMYRSYRFVWMLGLPMCFGLMLTSSNFVPWFFGEGYDGVIPLLYILSFLILAIGINNVTGVQYLIPIKRQNTFTLTVIIGAVVNFCLNMVLIYYFQAVGAAIASVVAETTIAVVQIIIVRKELKPWEIIKQSKNYVIAVIPMIVLLLFEAKYFSPSILHTLIMVVSGAAVYGSILLLMKDDLVYGTVADIAKKIKGKSSGR